MKERDYDAEIAALAFERDSRKLSASITGKLAVLIHDHTCGFNHTDGCGWLYEARNSLHDWEGQTHQMYFRRAEKIIEESPTLSELRKKEGA